MFWPVIFCPFWIFWDNIKSVLHLMMPFVIFQLTIPAMFLIVVFVFLLLCQITMDVWKSEPWFNLSTGSIKMKILKPALMFSHPNMNLLNGAKSWYSIDFVFYPPDQYLLIKHNIFDIHLLWQTIVFGAIAHPSLVAFHLQVKLFKRVKSSKVAPVFLCRHSHKGTHWSIYCEKKLNWILQFSSIL